MTDNWVFPFRETLKRWGRARLRRVLRGYQTLKKSGRIDRIARVKQALTEHHLGLAGQHFSSVVMGCGAASGEIVVRQYLLVRLGGTNLNHALLLAMGKERGRVVFPLPREWRDVLAQHDFEVAKFRSAILWQLYVFSLFFYGVLQVGKAVFAGATSGKSAVCSPKRYAYFAALGPGNLPQKTGDKKKYDVISWYLRWSGRTLDIEAIHHSVANVLPSTVGAVTVLSQPDPLPELRGWGSIFGYAVWGLKASVIAAGDYFRGRWWHALLLNQAALAARVSKVPADSLAREYLFHNSGWIYRPLWTYEAEQRGSAITFYFYSTNCESFKNPDGYPPLSYGYKAMSWPHYLVWDAYQADFVRRAIGEQSTISIVGPIWFQGSVLEVPRVDKPGIAVFDVTPHRASRYCILGADREYYTPAVVNSFLEHVIKVIRQHDFLMLWKMKRNIGQLAHPHYRRLAHRLAENSQVVLVDPEISAIRVIESSFAVISLPFTSTALIAREMGKPSVYYDPHGLLQRDDRAAHGIPVISGADELGAWLSAQVATQKRHSGPSPGNGATEAC